MLADQLTISTNSERVANNLLFMTEIVLIVVAIEHLRCCRLDSRSVGSDMKCSDAIRRFSLYRVTLTTTYISYRVEPTAESGRSSKLD